MTRRVAPALVTTPHGLASRSPRGPSWGERRPREAREAVIASGGNAHHRLPAVAHARGCADERDGRSAKWILIARLGRPSCLPLPAPHEKSSL